MDFDPTLTQPRRHRVYRTPSVFMIELHLQGNGVTDFCAGCLADFAVQVQIETAISHWHLLSLPFAYLTGACASSSGVALYITKETELTCGG
jgi:hypothetical protein